MLHAQYRFVCRSVCWLGLAAVVVCSIGCSTGRYPVTGVVKYADGTPIDGGTLIAEGEVDGKLVSLQANIAVDGKYSLGGATPGEGALPGEYRAMIMPVALGDAELSSGKKPSVSGKYGKFETSGITLKVVEGENKIDIGRFQVGNSSSWHQQREIGF